jgi:hypothetical protein
MFQFHVVLDQGRNWLDYVAPLGTVLAAAAATGTVFVALRIANNQNRLQKTLMDRQHDLQERELKKDLFDRRFLIFTDSLEFTGFVLRNNGDIVLEGAEYRHFREAMQKAGMLFGGDVGSYLNDLDKTVRDLYVSAKGRSRAVAGGDVAAIDQHGELLSHLIKLAPVAEDVFRPYLSL